eukprot:6204948-Pleurochrysis_carterae.AAC.4
MAAATIAALSAACVIVTICINEAIRTPPGKAVRESKAEKAAPALLPRTARSCRYSEIHRQGETVHSFEVLWR